MLRLVLVLFGVGIVASFSSACRPSPPEQTFGEVLYDIETRIKPERGSIAERSKIERTRVSASVSWEIRVRSSWPEYRAWLAARLGGEGGFHLKSENVSQVVFSRELPADVHSLTVQLLAAGPPVRIRVTFEAAAW